MLYILLYLDEGGIDSGEDVDVDDADSDYEPEEEEPRKKGSGSAPRSRAGAILFFPQEIEVLMREYGKHKDVLDSKTRSYAGVKKLWATIAQTVSETQGIRRSAEQCWKKVRNMKYMASLGEKSFKS
jgi:hypothetical protein